MRSVSMTGYASRSALRQGQPSGSGCAAVLCNPPMPAMGSPLHARLVFFSLPVQTLYSGSQQHIYTSVDDPPRAQQPMNLGSMVRTGGARAFNNVIKTYMSAKRLA